MSGNYDATWAAGSFIPGRRKNALDATVAPTGTDDSSEGFTPGSLWVDTVAGIGYLCISNTPGTADWQPVGSSSAYQHTQGVAALVWVVIHNLGRYPAITVIDSGGSEIEVAIDHDSLNQATLTLEYATSGIATCS